MKCLVSQHTVYFPRVGDSQQNVLKGLLFAELAPVAAIVGGILGQEVLSHYY